jgi:PHD/YefM family antitoxin component YafN of YafNO toxin-antitoxin module
MENKISVQEAASDFAKVLDSISATKEMMVVDDSGATVAILMSPEAFRSFRRERAWALIRQVQDRNAEQDPEDVLREVTEVVEEVRQEHYDRQRAALAGRT